MVPVHNLYYLLCYAWNRLPEPGEWQQLAEQEFHRPLELLTHLLLRGTRQLLRQGLPLGYAEREAELPELRGRVLLAPTLTRDLLRQGRAVCAFDELSADTPLAGLLAGTLEVLGRSRRLPAALRQQVRQVRSRFPGEVQPLPLSRSTLRQLRRLRLPAQSSFLLNLCALIHRTALPDPDAEGRHRYPDFRRDEALMAGIFERFVRNFYRLEQRRYRVGSETISWQAEAERPEDLALLPSMVTDTSLEAPDRKIILDTKYYKAAFKTHHDRQRLIAPHLYQLFAYLQNQATQTRTPLEGILLYPAATHEADLRYTLGGFPVRVVTLDLNQPWPAIAAALLALVE